MSNVRDINQQIAEVRNRRAQAAQAEEARIEAEQSNLRAIQQADAELERLEKERRKADFESAKQSSAGLLAQNESDIEAFENAMNVLLDVLQTQVLPAFEKAQVSYKGQRDHAMRIASHAADNPHKRFEASDQPVYGREAISDMKRGSFVRRELARALDQVPTGVSPSYVAIEWINGAKDEEERKARRMLVRGLLGQHFDPERRYSARERARREIEAGFLGARPYAGGGLLW